MSKWLAGVGAVGVFVVVTCLVGAGLVMDRPLLLNVGTSGASIALATGSVVAATRAERGSLDDVGGASSVLRFARRAMAGLIGAAILVVLGCAVYVIDPGDVPVRAMLLGAGVVYIACEVMYVRWVLRVERAGALRP